MGCDIHPSVEVFKKGKWTYHQPKTECPWYYEWEWDKTVSTRVSKLDEHGERIRSGWDNCKYSIAACFKDRDYLKFAVLADVRNDGVIIPISQPRGIPHNASPRTLGMLSDEHSGTWVTLRELEEYDYVDLMQRLVADDAAWAEPMGERLSCFGEMIEYMRALIPRGGTSDDVRIVMDFDS